MVEAIVEFDYEAQQEDELTITVGDIITNITKEEGGWWEGEFNGRRGLFPDNFVRELKKDMRKETTGSKPGDKPVTEVSSGSPSLSSDLTVKTSNKGEAIRKRRCKVAFSYAPKNEDELELKVGDIIEILSEVEEGWWEGILNGKTGMFPSNFTKEIFDQPGETRSSQEDSLLKLSTKDTTGSESDGGDSSSTKSEGANGPSAAEIQPKKIKGFGFGDIFKDKPIKLRPRSMEMENEILPTDKPTGKKLPPATTATTTTALEPGKSDVDSRTKTKEYCKVLFPYEAQNEDELTIKESEIVTITNKECADIGWWEGEVGGRRGVFPDNFVKLLPPDFEKERPKKPPPPSAPSAKPMQDKKTDVRKIPPERPDTLPNRTEDKDRPDKKQWPVDLQKPTVPAIPPKKPRPPKTNSLGKPSTLPPKRPERPAVPAAELRFPFKNSQVSSSQGSDSPKSDVGGSTVSSTPEKESSEKCIDTDFEGFDSIVSSTEKLNHPTASRPKASGRRPPSQVFTSSSLSSPDLLDSTSPEDDRDEKERDEHDGCFIPKIAELAKRPQQTVPIPPKPGPPILPSTGSSTQLPGPLASTLHPLNVSTTGHRPNSPCLLTAEVKSETEPISQGQHALEEMRAQIRDLKNVIEMMKNQHRKEIKQLMNELDEEKKIRLTLQMEVDGIKKALQSK
ncbi:SH3 domain-containing kinase-binding protein 1 isoform X3 [Protopterus annectens]|uniref:SH3 domain-containing kinase-binding protein 1 isoform X3 n=1 Tax=Protopterus annectens TaxID=7888 RepID=UPI001CF9A71D|nr:SH3 domain-containing kinase-binding protein 1 isoform X3 [Protopterus annectens]